MPPRRAPLSCGANRANSVVRALGAEKAGASAKNLFAAPKAASPQQPPAPAPREGAPREREALLEELRTTIGSLEEDNSFMSGKLNELITALINSQEDASQYQAEYERIVNEGRALYTAYATKCERVKALRAELDEAQSSAEAMEAKHAQDRARWEAEAGARPPPSPAVALEKLAELSPNTAGSVATEEPVIIGRWASASGSAPGARAGSARCAWPAPGAAARRRASSSSRAAETSTRTRK